LSLAIIDDKWLFFLFRFIFFWNFIDLMGINLFSLSRLLLFQSMSNGHVRNLSIKTSPDPCESKPETFVDDCGWSVNSSNLSSSPEEWLNPFDPDCTSSVGWSLNQNDSLETGSSYDTIRNSILTVF
jgi:hypothetical protein